MVYATEMATEIVDNAQQAFGAMGVTRELPLQLMARKVRLMRVSEGRARSTARSLRAACCARTDRQPRAMGFESADA